jgi:hypothetical protein
MRHAVAVRNTQDIDAARGQGFERTAGTRRSYHPTVKVTWGGAYHNALALPPWTSQGRGLTTVEEMFCETGGSRGGAIEGFKETMQ